MMEPLPPDSYAEFLADLKSRIPTAQLRASLAVNRELVLLYWQIGRNILDRQQRESWGAKVIDRLAADLKRAFPDIKGFSLRNLKYMRAFAEAWPDEAFVQAVLAQITWYHNLAILEKPRQRIGFGMPRRRFNMDGAATCSFIRSKQVVSIVRGRPLPTLTAHFHPHNPIWRRTSLN
jgi:predicted nuclease of restriction endonuclease-like (RecB) superfamily